METDNELTTEEMTEEEKRWAAYFEAVGVKAVWQRDTQLAMTENVSKPQFSDPTLAVFYDPPDQGDG